MNVTELTNKAIEFCNGLGSWAMPTVFVLAIGFIAFLAIKIIKNVIFK